METMNYLDLAEKPQTRRPPMYNDEVSSLIHELLLALGENPEREGLVRTPERVARMFNELLAGYEVDLEELVNDAVFESDYREMVLVRDIEFYSLCEHHMLPFFGKVHVAYIPDGRIIGLSKIPRLVEMFARRLQVQERMTQQIAEMIDEILKPKGVIVLAEGSHMCAMMRGVKKADTRMVTTATTGVYRTDQQLREEFLSSLKKTEREKSTD